MDCWLTIEVLDGAGQPARGWRRMHGERLIESAISNRAQQWTWHEHRWGVVLEVEFSDEESRELYRRLPAVTAALDAVPDPVSGLLVYPGRGGGSASTVPRRPRPIPLAGAGALPEPDEEQFVTLSETTGDHVDLRDPAAT